MRSLTGTFLIAVLNWCSYASAGTYDLVGPQEAEAFMRRPSVDVQPPHGLELHRTRYLLVAGEPRGSRCVYAHHYDPIAYPSNRERVYNSIDVAVDTQRCEKLVEEGYTVRRAHLASGALVGARATDIPR